MSDMNENTGADSAAAAATESKTRKISMKDGRTVEFGEKTRIKKEYGVADGNVFARIDFDNGEVVEVQIEAGNAPAVLCQAAGHGLIQKLGDAAAGAESTEDAYESILEVAARINGGEWNKVREGGSSNAKGASELVQALSVALGQDKETIRGMMASLSAGEKAALRKVPAVADAIEKIRAEKKPSKADAEKVEKANALFAGLQAAVAQSA